MSFFENVRACRRCGCTEHDCSECVERTGEACFWVENDLCSACVGFEAYALLARLAKATPLHYSTELRRAKEFVAAVKLAKVNGYGRPLQLPEFPDPPKTKRASRRKLARTERLDSGKTIQPT